MENFSVDIQSVKLANSEFTESPMVTVRMPQDYAVSFEWEGGRLLFLIEDFLEMAQMVSIMSGIERLKIESMERIKSRR